MGKKGGKTKGRAVIVESNANLGAFDSAQALKEQQEAEFRQNLRDHDSHVPTGDSQAKQQEKELGFTLQAQAEEKAAGTNESEKAFNKLCREIDQQTGAGYDHNHFEMTTFAHLDNNLIDSVFSNLMTLT